MPKNLPETMKVDICNLERYAIEKYIECPRQVSIVLHADHIDDSESHCVPATPFVGPVRPGAAHTHRRDFLIPCQKVRMVEDPKYGLFSIIRVLEKEEGPEYLLVASVQQNRMGFLLPAGTRIVGQVEKKKRPRPASKLLQDALCNMNWFSSMKTEGA